MNTCSSDHEREDPQLSRGCGTRSLWMWLEWQQSSLVPSAIISIEMARSEDLRESPSAQEQRATSKGLHDMEDLPRKKSAQKVGLTNGSPVQKHLLKDAAGC